MRRPSQKRSQLGWGLNERPVLNQRISTGVPSTMLVVSSLQTHLHSSACTHPYYCKGSSSSLLYLRHLYGIPIRPRAANCNGKGVLLVRAYTEDSNTFSGFANKVIGSLPVIGLVARILSDEGGVGGDVIDFAEFRRRVGNKCSINDSRAFYEFQDRHGRSGDPLYVLLCCWLAAAGAGLLKSEDILEGVARLRLSNDIEFEEETFLAMMNEAREKRANLKASAPVIPMEIRAEKALEAIYVCCLGTNPIEEEDEKLLSIMLNSVFPTVGQSVVERIVKEKIKKLAEGSRLSRFAEPKALSKEAVQQQLKDLQFLKQMDETQ